MGKNTPMKNVSFHPIEAQQLHQHSSSRYGNLQSTSLQGPAASPVLFIPIWDLTIHLPSRPSGLTSTPSSFDTPPTDMGSHNPPPFETQRPYQHSFLSPIDVGPHSLPDQKTNNMQTYSNFRFSKKPNTTFIV